MRKEIQIVDMGVSTSLKMQAALRECGYTVTTCLFEDWQQSAVPSKEPDVWVVCGQTLDQEAVKEISTGLIEHPRPMLIFIDHMQEALMSNLLGAGVSMVVIDGFQEKRLPSLISLAEARFEQHQKLTRELANVKSRLDDRKFIERAKGFLMNNSGLTEDEAYAKLRKVAMNRGVKLVQVAHETIALFEPEPKTFHANP